MTSTRSPSTNAKTRSAARRIESFRQRFGDGHFYLACHAALPLALTPDLLYSLWANFQRDVHGEAIDIPWIAVADLMLSNLCKEVGNELYEMDQPVRDDLLKQLQNDSRFGLERLRELADFVMAYVEQQLDSPDLDARDLAQGQQWRALTYKNPSEAAHSIATVLAQLPLDDKAEWIRMAALLNSLSEPLSAFQPLLNYTQAMADLAKGNLAAATAQMAQAVDANNQVRVEGVNLPIPDVLNGTLPKSQEPDAAPISPPNRLKMPIAIAGGTIASVLILLGVQYGLRSPDSRQTPDVTSSATPSSQTSSSPINPRTTPTPKTTPPATLPVQTTPSSSTSKPSPSPLSTLLPQPNSTSPKEARPTNSPATPSPTLAPATPATTSSATAASPTQEKPQVVASSGTVNSPKPLPPQIQLNVPYYSQLDNAKSPYFSSGPTSVAMALAYYGVEPKKPQGRLPDELMQWTQSKGLDFHSPDALVTTIKAYGYGASFNTKSTIEEVKQYLASGYPVLVAGYFAPNGQVICLIGYTPQGFIVNDPMGQWTPETVNSDPLFPNYRIGVSGKAVVYSYEVIKELAMTDNQFWTTVVYPKQK